MANEAIVANIKLKHEYELGEARRNDPTKSVRVNMEESQVGQKPKFRRQVPCNVTMVQINASHNLNVWVIKRRSTEDAGVRTNIGANPIGSHVLWVGINS